MSRWVIRMFGILLVLVLLLVLMQMQRSLAQKLQERQRMGQSPRR